MRVPQQPSNRPVPATGRQVVGAMPRAWRRIAALAFLLAGLGTRAAGAQQGEVAGVVVDGSSLTPLPLVRVSVGTNAAEATSTDGRGRFRLTGLTGTTISLTFRRIGYQPRTETVTIGQTDLRITLSATPARLEDVVVTGTADAVQKVGSPGTELEFAL